MNQSLLTNRTFDELKVGVNSGQGTLDGPPATIVNLGSAERPRV